MRLVTYQGEAGPRVAGLREGQLRGFERSRSFFGHFDEVVNRRGTVRIRKDFPSDSERPND